MYLSFTLDSRSTLLALGDFLRRHAPYYWAVSGRTTETPKVESVFTGDCWPYHEGFWYLFKEGTALAEGLDSYAPKSIPASLEFVDQLVKRHGWVILPWGREEAVPMIAFAAADESVVKDFNSAFSTTRLSHPATASDASLQTSSDGLLLSTYDWTPPQTFRPHGIMYDEGAETTFLWDSLDAELQPPYVLRVRPARPDPGECQSLPGVTELETYPDRMTFLRRALLQVSTPEAFNSLRHDWGTAIAFSGKLDIESLRELLGLQEFTEDPCRHLPQLLMHAEWILIPKSGYSSARMYETLVVRDPNALLRYMAATITSKFQLFSFF